MTEQGILTIDEAAELLRLSRRTLERRIASGELPVLRTGPGRSAIRISREDLVETVARWTVGGRVSA